MRLMFIGILFGAIRKGRGFLNVEYISPLSRSWLPTTLAMSSSGATDVVLSWSDLQEKVGMTAVGAALNEEVKLRSEGKGSAHVQNKLRKFDSDDEPVITLFRDHAGW